MPNLYVARRAPRKAVLLTIPGGRDSAFILPKNLSASELDEMMRAQLEKQGVSPADHEAVVARAELEYEKRQKVEEAQREVKRLMGLKANGATLMQVGFRKWKEVWYPAGPRKAAKCP